MKGTSLKVRYIACNLLVDLLEVINISGVVVKVTFLKARYMAWNLLVDLLEVNNISGVRMKVVLTCGETGYSEEY